MMSLSPKKVQARLSAVYNNKLFEFFVIGVILLSALVIGAKTYEIDRDFEQVITLLDTTVTVIFLVEILVRMAVEGSLIRFFRKGWNVFDFVIVAASMIPVDESQTVLLARLLRVFRVLRLVSIVPELRILLNALVKAIPRMGYVVLLMFIIFYIYGALGSFLFDSVNPERWSNVSISMLTLFRVATFEDWTDLMYETNAVYPLSWLFYLSFIFLTAFVFLNMMIGVILDVMQSEHEKFNREQGEGEAGEVHWIREHTAAIESRLERIEQALRETSK